MSSRPPTSPSGRRPARLMAACGAAALAVVVVGGATFALGKSSPGGAGGTGRASGDPSTTTSTVAKTPLAVSSVTPSAGATNVDPGSPVQVTFSAPVGPGAPMPTLTPATPGAWSVSGATMTFTPQGGFVPFTSVKLDVPAGITGAAGTNTVPLPAATTGSFTIAPGSTLRLQQLLAGLGYLPLSFTPAGSTSSAPASSSSTASTAPAGSTSASNPGSTSTSTGSTSTSTGSTSSPVATGNGGSPGGPFSSSPVPGSFSWRFADTPASLVSLWHEGSDNVITRAAVMAFESVHNLGVDATAGPQVWTALLVAASAGQANPNPYNYLMVNQGLPESIKVWSKGQVIATSPVNTGVPGAITATGTFPVFERFASTTMRGTNPDGSTYADPGVPWVAYFNGGDAVHGFPRDSYGYPQSDGCVELPIDNAKVIWGMDPIGTLVTVS